MLYRATKTEINSSRRLCDGGFHNWRMRFASESQWNLVLERVGDGVFAVLSGSKGRQANGNGKGNLEGGVKMIIFIRLSFGGKRKK